MANLNSVEILLAAVSTFGPLTIGVILFLGPLGLPFPSALLVLATGAFVLQGLMNWQTRETAIKHHRQAPQPRRPRWHPALGPQTLRPRPAGQRLLQSRPNPVFDSVV